MWILLVGTLALAEGLEPWQQTWNLAATANNRRDHASCLQALQAQNWPPDKDARFLDLGYTCAVASSNLAAADLFRQQLGPTYLPQSALDIHHAWMLDRADRPRDALRVIVPEGWTTQRQREVGTTMQAILLRRIGRWGAATMVAGSPFVDRDAKLSIAQDLRDEGWLPESYALYDLVCPELDNRDEAGCSSVVAIPISPPE
jgi:hypothetical protein